LWNKDGEKNGDGHGHGGGGGKETVIPYKIWIEWEKIRRNALELAEMPVPVGLVMHPHNHVPQEMSV
jgi:hypothetical protein